MASAKVCAMSSQLHCINSYCCSSFGRLCHADDIFTAIDFDASGRFIALGDKAGRITVFESVDDFSDDAKVASF